MPLMPLMPLTHLTVFNLTPTQYSIQTLLFSLSTCVLIPLTDILTAHYSTSEKRACNLFLSQRVQGTQLILTDTLPRTLSLSSLCSFLGTCCDNEWLVKGIIPICYLKICKADLQER